MYDAYAQSLALLKTDGGSCQGHDPSRGSALDAVAAVAPGTLIGAKSLHPHTDDPPGHMKSLRRFGCTRLIACLVYYAYRNSLPTHCPNAQAL